MATETETPEPGEGVEPTESAPGQRLLDHRRVERLLSGSLYVVAGLLIAFLWIPLAVMIFLSFSENASGEQRDPRRQIPNSVRNLQDRDGEKRHAEE
jgi:hypothetical protein